MISKKNIKKTVFVVLATMSIGIAVLPSKMLEVKAEENLTELDTGTTMTAQIPQVSNTGEDLRNDTQDGLRFQSRNGRSILENATVKNDYITIAGNVNGVEYQVEGEFTSISENGNVLVFNTEDKLGNFRVVYTSVEKEIEESALYFKSFAEKNDVVTKLYLNPIGSEELILVEVFGNAFPQISESAIESLPENHYLEQYWYINEFEPVETKTEELEPIMERAGTTSHPLSTTYVWNYLGVKDTHSINYTEKADIRDVVLKSSAAASATLEVTKKGISSTVKNNNSSTQSTLSLRDVAITYKTRPYTAVMEQKVSGTVTKSGSAKTSFNHGIKLDIKTLSVTVTPNVMPSWSKTVSSHKSDLKYDAHTNTTSKYWRSAQGLLESKASLNAKGNKMTVAWTYGSYEGSKNTKSATISFNYQVYNTLTPSSSKNIANHRSINVAVK